MPTARKRCAASCGLGLVGRVDDDRRAPGSTNADFVPNDEPDTGTLTAPGR